MNNNNVDNNKGNNYTYNANNANNIAKLLGTKLFSRK